MRIMTLKSGTCYIITAALVLAQMVLPAMVSADWPTFRGDIHNTGYLDSDVSKVRSEAWIKNLNSGAIDTTPIVSNGKVYVVSNGEFDWTSFIWITKSRVHCLSESTGEAIWSTEIESQQWQSSSPAISNGKVLLGSTSGDFYCLSENSGEILWSRSTGLGINFTGITSSPVVKDDRVYIGAGNGRLYCFDLSGNEIWNFSVGANIYTSSPTIVDDRIYIGSDNCRLYCVKKEDGSELWNFSTSGRVRTTAAYYNEKLYFVASLYHGDWAIVDGYLYCINTDGSQEWVTNIGISSTSPTIAHDKIFVGTSEGFYCYNMAGEELWEFTPNGPVSLASCATNGEVLFMTNVNDSELNAHSTLYCLDFNGNQIWNYTLKPYQWALSSPSISDGTVFVASDNGHVYSLESGHKENGDEVNSPYIIMAVVFFLIVILVAVIVRSRR